jgi:predicted choloylglycine hydrolase
MKTTMTTIAGGRPGDVLTVRHLRADGTQHEIGRALARAATDVHGSAAAPRRVADTAVEEARRRWFSSNHPVHSVRMRGIADHFGLDPHDTTWSLDWLGTYEVPAGCSVAFYPGATTKSGHGVLSRNFDFPTATFSQITGRAPLPGERPLAADPWVVELHPDDGYASVTVGIMDVMGGMDGINEAGLTVALLADNETPEPEPTGAPAVGLSEQQVVRYLLDTCATVAEAKQALLVAKHYYFFTPCHFVVADRSGESFVWEHSPRRNREWIIGPEARDGRLVCTNHLLHRWPDPTRLPADDGTIGTAAFTYRRWRTLNDATADGIVGDDDIREQFRAVSFVAPIVEARTFWHALYDVDDASAELTFHVRDVDGVSIYTDPIRLELGQE